MTDLAQVRYVKAKRAAGGTEEQKSYWIATVQYSFAEPAKDPKTRRWNPLGFKVVEFRPEPEAMGPESSPPPARAAMSKVRVAYLCSGDRRCVLIALLVVRCAQAETLPVRGSTDPRIRTAAYSADEIYRLDGFVGYHLDLEFETDESFTGISAGDPEALTYSAHDNVLTLRPKVELAQMNLTVSTNRRRYYFEYSVSTRRPNRIMDDVMYAVRFTYPPAEVRRHAQLGGADQRGAGEGCPEPSAQHRLLVLRQRPRSSPSRHRMMACIPA